jgi:hypothetical protein
MSIVVQANEGIIFATALLISFIDMGINVFKVMTIVSILDYIPTCFAFEFFNLFEIMPALKKGFNYS